MAAQGKLFVISAPSGAGKTTLIREVLKQFKSLSYSISSTTRPPRKNETDGRDYFFITAHEFEEKIRQGAWLEWARVHDHYYGTSRSVVEQTLEQGRSLLLDIDVQGAAQVIESDLSPVTLFILPPSVEELERRLKGRGTDEPAVIEKRLKNAVAEMAQKDTYQYRVVNDDLETAVNEILSIFKKELA